MRSRRTLADGRILDFAGTNRYAAFRLTIDGGYPFTSSQKSQDCVVRAREMWHIRGFKTLVLDTQTGEFLAGYPAEMMDLTKEKSV